ncbi:MAG: hypothetical protein ACI9CE_003959, partial [Flavobacterium sp.]
MLPVVKRLLVPQVHSRLDPGFSGQAIDVFSH